jgi:hypothetical protein
MRARKCVLVGVVGGLRFSFSRKDARTVVENRTGAYFIISAAPPVSTTTTRVRRLAKSKKN